MGAIDARALRDAFGAFMTGVTVATTLDQDGAPRGFTANSFASVSLDPPLLLVCLARTSRSFAAFCAARHFAVNVLADDQRDIAGAFSRLQEDRFAGVRWGPGPAGSPVLENVAAWFDCSRHQLVEAGDHVILIGRVEAFQNSGRTGIGYARGGYVDPALSDRAVTAAHAPKVIVGAIVRSPGGVLLVREGDGWGIPRAEMAGQRGPATALDRLVGSCGLIASFGFIYAVYEEGAVQHIVYRCDAADDPPLKGRFTDLETLEPDSIADPAVRGMLTRFAAESRLGAFGVYTGDARRGAVRRLAPED